MLSFCFALLAVGAAAGSARAGAGPDIEPAVCSGCEPPLDYAGGPVMATHTAGGMVVVPLYWGPTSGPQAFPARFETTIDQFIANVAAASGRTNNVFSVATEYYSERFGLRSSVRYSIRAGSPIVDTAPLPRSGCKPARGYAACITDAQLRLELTRVRRSRGLPADLDHYYAVFFPPGVETTGTDGTTSVDGYCAYHKAFGSGAEQTVYSNQPFDQSNCSPGQSPNGSLAADSVIGVFSHELIEVMTDPVDEPRAWDDKTGHEIADMCIDTYGRAIGSTVASYRSGTQYNQVINGGKYYLPLEFSNVAYERFGADRGCVPSEAAAKSQAAAATGANTDSPQTFVVDATPTTLPADGSATSTIDVISSDTAGNGLAGDHIHFSLGLAAGEGQCGTLSSTDATTDAQGEVRVVYKASNDSVSCWVLAVDGEGGRSAEAVIYQGTTGSTSPALETSFPTSLQAGGAPAVVSVKARNPSAEQVPDTLVHLVILPAGPNAPAVEARQLSVLYSTTARGGRFIPVPLVGSTRAGNSIQGYIGPLRGSVLARYSSETLKIRLGLLRSVPISKTRPLLAFHAYLEQTDPASGADASLADSNPTAVIVPTAAASHTLRDIAIGAGVLLLALAAAGLLWRPRHR